jgi:ribose/xylose/arabinose/galactoside ABC-type transport system permease subunit
MSHEARFPFPVREGGNVHDPIGNENMIKRKLAALFQKPESSILITLVIICVVTTLINPSFVMYDNIVDILRSIAFTVIVAVGMTFVITSAGLDLSVGSLLGLCGMIAGWAMVSGLAVPIAIFLGILTGALMGLLNGFVIVRFGIPPLIVTLGTMYIARGIIYVISKGTPFYPFPDAFNQIGQGTLNGIPYSIFIAAAVLVAGWFLLRYTTFGRRVLAVGGNEEAARVSGINIGRVKLMVYLICGVTAAITGILIASRLSSAQANSGTGWEITVIAAVIIGGTSLFGGSGTIVGTLIGASIMNVLTNAMVLMRISVYWQNIIVGAIIIVAVGFDTYRRKRIASVR